MDTFDLLRGAVVGAFSITTVGILASLVYYRAMRTQLEKVPPDDPPRPVLRVLVSISYLHLPAALWFTATFVLRYLGGIDVEETMDASVVLSMTNYLIAYVVLLAPPATLIHTLYDFEQGD